MKDPLIVLTVTPSTTKELRTMITRQASADPPASPEFNVRMESCFQNAATYWREFQRLPESKELLKHLPSVAHHFRAFELFLFGFTGRMLLVPPGGDTPWDKLFLRFRRDRLWREYLRTCHGEIVLDGEHYPKTPPLILRMAETFFNAGLSAGDGESVARAADAAQP